MKAKTSLLSVIQSGALALLTPDEIAYKLKLGARERTAVREILRALVREGELLSDSRGRVGTAEQFRAKRGTISGNERGFAFFVPDDGTPDLFLPPHAVKDALHGDSVLACKVGGKSGDEGEVLAIVSRGMHEIVGTYRREGKAGYLIPDEKRFCADVYIPAGRQNGCQNGAKAVARIFSYKGRTPYGEIAEVLGANGDLFVEELALIRAHELRETFPDDVLAEAERQAARGLAKSLRGRLDLRKELIVTVDGEDTRDIDDAISVGKQGDLFLLGVHIADVSHYVMRGSALDREAFKRGTSVYFPDRVLPMLPPALSNGVCSLNEGEDRLTLSCLMKIDGAGRIVEKKIVPSVIRSAHRMTYTDFSLLFDGDETAKTRYPDLHGFVETAKTITTILQRARAKRGGVFLDVKEAKIVFRNGKIEIPDFERTLAHDMIECFMVAANESVAQLMEAKGAPFIYRVHERPSEEKTEELLAFLRELGLSPKFTAQRVAPRDYAALLERLEGSPLAPLVNRVVLRSMMKARYSPQNAGHFGLASQCYCHFTSPIRRYPDLCVHRIIKESLSEPDPERVKTRFGGFVQDAADRSSLCERNAQEAERDVDALYIACYMQDKIGEMYEATVSGVTSYGLFAELANTVEGYIPLEALPDDSYECSEQRHLLRGTKHSFRLGQKILVKVSGVDWGARKVQFSFLEQRGKKI